MHNFLWILIRALQIFLIAAAEVTVHGCCSSLNKTAPHHLGVTGSIPPDIIRAMTYRARIFSQTHQNGNVRLSLSRILLQWKSSSNDNVCGLLTDCLIFRLRHAYYFVISLAVMINKLIGRNRLCQYSIGKKNMII